MLSSSCHSDSSNLSRMITFCVVFHLWVANHQQSGHIIYVLSPLAVGASVQEWMDEGMVGVDKLLFWCSYIFISKCD